MVLSNDPTLLPNTNISRAGSPPDCTISLYPAANRFGTASIQLKAFDGSLFSPLTTMTLTVNAVNDAPVMQTGGAIGSLSTPQNTPLNIPLANGSDIENDPLVDPRRSHGRGQRDASCGVVGTDECDPGPL